MNIKGGIWKNKNNKESLLIELTQINYKIDKIMFIAYFQLVEKCMNKQGIIKSDSTLFLTDF